MYVYTHVLKIINMRNWLQWIGAKNVLRQKNPAKKNLEKYWSLSKMICSSVRLNAAKKKLTDTYVRGYVSVYGCICILWKLMQNYKTV